MSKLATNYVLDTHYFKIYTHIYAKLSKLFPLTEADPSNKKVSSYYSKPECFSCILCYWNKISNV